MSTKSSVWIGMIIGSTIGEFIPSLWGASALSFSAILWGSAGAIAGIYIGFNMAQ